MTTISTYSSFSGIKARIIATGSAPECKVLSDKVGIKKMHPLTEQRGYDKYPLYSIVDIDGFTEIFEQKRPEPFLYITDNPTLTEVLRKENRQ